MSRSLEQIRELARQLQRIHDEARDDEAAALSDALDLETARGRKLQELIDAKQLGFSAASGSRLMARMGALMKDFESGTDQSAAEDMAAVAGPAPGLPPLAKGLGPPPQGPSAASASPRGAPPPPPPPSSSFKSRSGILSAGRGPAPSLSGPRDLGQLRDRMRHQRRSDRGCFQSHDRCFIGRGARPWVCGTSVGSKSACSNW